MITPVLNAVSQTSLEALLAHEPHALLITGPVGSGLATIAAHYTAGVKQHVWTVLPEKDEKIDLEKGTITIDSIRKLYDHTKTVEPNGRIVIIDYAERMAPAAQNAFLKLLEEPTVGTRFILLTHNPALLLPTITSRAQKVAMRPISAQQSNDLLDTLGVKDATKRSQLLFIAQGFPAELTRLATDESLFEARVAIVRDAREYISGSGYARLLIAKKYKDSRANALTLLEDAMKQLQQTIAKGGDAGLLRLAARLEVLHKRVTEQGNVRLQLSAAIMVQ